MLTNFPNGISSFGVPVIGGGSLIPPTTGKYVFVHSGTGSNQNEGDSPSAPMATIDGAVGKCTANAGDIIIVMPGHAENISAATSLVVDVAGVQIIGLGHGRNRPVLTYTATAGTIEMDAANTRLSNVVLRASVSAVVVGINVDADGVTLDSLEFTFDETGDDFVTMVDIDAVNLATVQGCYFRAEETAGAAEAIRLDDCDYVRIVGNQFTGIWSDAPIIGEGAVGVSLLIADNVIYNGDTSDQNGIDLNVAFTGLITNNRIGTLYATGIAGLLDPGSCLCSQNYATNAIDETGALVPVTAST